jgi:endoglucanase
MMGAIRNFSLRWPDSRRANLKLLLNSLNILSSAFLFVCLTRSAVAATLSEQIIVDQFGWRADAPRKVVLFANPQRGQNAGKSYLPGSSFQLRRTSDNALVFTGPVTPWKGGAIDNYSGDQVWWGDFSSFLTPGEYVAYDPVSDLQSYPFSLHNNIYNEVLKTAARMFYYQRCGQDLSESHGSNWNHQACHIGSKQDLAAELYITAPQGGPRDVSGGWHDAGDYNKYVPFTIGPMWDLMMAYELNPRALGDDWNIPESGNGVPDLLDEIKWELDWLLRMQLADGSVLNRVAVTSYNNGTGPTMDTQPRYYTQATTWATGTFCGLTAHAARVYAISEGTYPGYSSKLREASEKAWQFLQAHPAMTPSSGKDGPTMAAAGADGDTAMDKRLRIYSAAELFRTTGNNAYHDYFKGNYKDSSASDGGQHPILKNWWDASQAWELNRAFIVYAGAGGADPGILGEIKGSLKNTMDTNIAAHYTSGEDAYRGFVWEGHYCWGSNNLRANWAKLALFAASLNVDSSRNALYDEIAEEYLHYFHGRNALSYIYLSNMGSKGANLSQGKSPMEIYHGWFQDNSPLYDGMNSLYGPAPGYLVGGPNKFFAVSWISPPYGEPPAKAFKDWNGAWNSAHNANENSWEITEPAIYYQGAYVLLLSHFVPPLAPPEVRRPIANIYENRLEIGSTAFASRGSR